MSRFMDPTTDFGFKKLFGKEANKDIIISFITDVLELKNRSWTSSFWTRNSSHHPARNELVFTISSARMQRGIGLFLKCRKIDWRR